MVNNLMHNLMYNLIYNLIYCYGTVLTHTVLYCLVLFPTIGWPTTSALVAASTIYI